MTNEAQLAGVTPYVARLAAHYAALGIGTYKPKGYSQFDRVEVRIKMPWQTGETLTTSCLIIVVEFYAGEEMQRYVEFALTPSGFSGKPILKVALPSDGHGE